MQPIATDSSVVPTVRIADWTNPRRIIIHKDRALLEIARTSDDCHLCATCHKRASRVEEFLRGGSYVWRWEIFNEGKWLSLALPAGADPVRFLADATGLTIDGIAPAKAQPTRASGSTVLAPDAKVGRVSVNGWQYRRRVAVEPGRVLLEITVGEHNHCATCNSRVRHISETLAGKPAALPRWEYVGSYGSRWVSIPRTTAAADPLDLLRQTLDVRLAEVRWND